MRRVTGFVFVGIVAIGLVGCGRVQTGEKVGQATLVSERPRPKATKPTSEAPKPAPLVAPATGMTTAAPSPTAPTPSATPSPATSPTPSPTGEKVSPPAPEKLTPPVSPSPTPAAAPTPKSQPTPTVEVLPLADEVRSVRAILESLRTQFDRLPPDEVRMRLLLAEQGLSEIEVRSPALVLWRTALRLEALQKAPTPDLALAKAWLLRARQWLSGEGLTTITEAEKALAANRWADGIGALRSAAQRWRADEQLAAIAQTRASLLNALDALERQKPAVARAEIGESLKGIDRLLTALP
jgi:hypothetical protein